MVCGLSACAPMSSSFKATDVASSAIKAPPPIEGPVDKLTCLNRAVDYELSTDIVSFHMTDSRGLRVGVKAPISGVPVGIDLGVTYSTGDLNTAMHLTRPLYGPDSVADKPGNGTNKQISFSADFGIQIVNLGFSYLKATPIGKLIESALVKNLQNLFADIRDPWSTHISEIYGASDIEIPVGTSSGIQVGDEFDVYDVSYRWHGEPCESTLSVVRRNSPDPVATLVATQASSPTTTILAVKNLHGSLPLAKYQQVILAKQFIHHKQTCEKDRWTGKQKCKIEPIPRAALKRSVRLGGVSGDPIYFNINGATRPVEVNRMAETQLGYILNSDAIGFYIRK
jgi:hypothetical protein